MNLFGKAKKQAPTPKESIVKLRETLDMLDKREKFLQTKIENEIKLARANGTRNKRAAMMALKRKKAYEGQIDKIMGAKLTLESQVMTIENANVNLEAMNAMKSGADAMKSIHGRVDIDKVDTTMDDIRDQMDLANEISDAISQPVGFGLDMDEDELQQELDELEQIDLDEKLLDNSALPQTRVKPRVEEEDIGESLPSVPTGEPKVALPPRPSRVQVEEDEDAELSELRASMAM